jgi:hypothetical protein
MKIFKLSALASRGIGIAAVIICSFSAVRALAGYIVTLEQVGPNVVANGHGTIDLTGLSFIATQPITAAICPEVGWLFLGPTSIGSVDTYGLFGGPTNF